MPGETVYEALERLKKYLHQCPQHGLSKYKIVPTFYKGIDKPIRNTIDNSAGGTIMHKTPNEAYKLIKDIAVVAVVIIDWVVHPDAVWRSCNAVLRWVVTASRVICDAVSSF
ncbi:hypothetical protein Tco_0083901 [Tanacetum coccineum]